MRLARVFFGWRFEIWAAPSHDEQLDFWFRPFTMHSDGNLGTLQYPVQQKSFFFCQWFCTQVSCSTKTNFFLSMVLHTSIVWSVVKYESSDWLMADRGTAKSLRDTTFVLSTAGIKQRSKSLGKGFADCLPGIGHPSLILAAKTSLSSVAFLTKKRHWDIDMIVMTGWQLCRVSWCLDTR